MRSLSVDRIAGVVGGLDCGRRVGWAGLEIDRGLAFVVGFLWNFRKLESRLQIGF